MKRDPIIQQMEKEFEGERMMDEMFGLDESHYKKYQTPRGRRQPCRGRRIDFGAPTEQTIVEEPVLVPSPRHLPSRSPIPSPSHSPGLFYTEGHDVGLEQTSPPAILEDSFGESPIPGELQESPTCPWYLDEYRTPPHARELERRSPTPCVPAHGDTVDLPYSLQLQLQNTAGQTLEDENVFLVDDTDLPPESPVRPCPPSPPSPPSPPPRSPSPRAANIFQEVGVEYSPRSQALATVPPTEEEEFYIPKFRPAWLQEQLTSGRHSRSPERTVTQRSSEGRYVLQYSPKKM